MIDALYGFFNFYPKILGFIKTVFSFSKGDYSKFDLVTVTIKRKDKGGKYSLGQIKNHLEDYGIRLVSWNYDSKNFYLKVRRNQEKWVAYLLTDLNNIKLRKPKTKWK